MNPTTDLIKENNMTVYQRKGYNDRQEYLLSLSEEYEMGYEDVLAIADVLGEVEDFDGLVSALDEWDVLNSSFIEYAEQVIE